MPGRTKVTRGRLSRPERERPGPWVLARATVLWGSVVGVVGFLALNGRPVADDYCNAGRAARLGVLGASESLFRTWHGGWSADLAVSLYGRLLVELPFRWGYVPFAVTTLVLVVLAAWAVTAALGLGRDRERSTWLLHVPLVTVLLMLGVASSSRSQDLLFGAYLWQAASVVHLWPMLLGLALLALAARVRRSPGLGVDAALVAGAVVVSGFNLTETAVFGVAAFLLGAGCLLAAAPRDGDAADLRRTGRRYATIWLAAVGSFAVMYLSPGTAARRAVIESSDEGLVERLTRFQDLVTALLASSLGRHGVVLALAAGVALAVVSRRPGRRPVDAGRAAAVAVLLAGTATLGSLVMAAGQLASYPAPWHAMALIPLWVVSALALGLCVGAALPLPGAQGSGGSRVEVLAQALPVVVAALLVLHVAWYAGPLTSRSSLWDNGVAAPIAGAADRETDWVNVCWEELVPLATATR